MKHDYLYVTPATRILWRQSKSKPWMLALAGGPNCSPVDWHSHLYIGHNSWGYAAVCHPRTPEERDAQPRQPYFWLGYYPTETEAARAGREVYRALVEGRPIQLTLVHVGAEQDQDAASALSLWLITPPSDVKGYDTYDSAVVAAATEDEARCIHPAAHMEVRGNLEQDHWEAVEGMPHGPFADPEPRWRPASAPNSWADHPSEVRAKRLGSADANHSKPSLILASYNAG